MDSKQRRREQWFSRETPILVVASSELPASPERLLETPKPLHVIQNLGPVVTRQTLESILAGHGRLWKGELVVLGALGSRVPRVALNPQAAGQLADYLKPFRSALEELGVPEAAAAGLQANDSLADALTETYLGSLLADFEATFSEVSGALEATRITGAVVGREAGELHWLSPRPRRRTPRFGW